MKKRARKLTLSRETLGAMDASQLWDVAGGTSLSTCAEATCPSACIGMCNPSDTCLSQCAQCPNHPFPTRNENC